LLALPDKPSIAVLPFANLNDDAKQAYLADGIVEDFEAPPQIEFAADGVGYEVIGSLEAITNQVGPAT
jgi:hypothetical protein